MRERYVVDTNVLIAASAVDGDSPIPSDRKMVGAALEAIRVFGEAVIANASDTDWYDWEAGLVAAGVAVEQILPEWSRAKYNEKRSA